MSEELSILDDTEEIVLSAVKNSRIDLEPGNIVEEYTTTKSDKMKMKI